MINKLDILLKTSRPISWVNTAYPFAVGYVMSGGDVSATLIIGTIFFLIPYNLAMYGINDVYDYESDIKNPRKGGIEGAVTSKKYHPLILWSSLGLSLPPLIYLIWAGNTVSNLVLLGVMFFVVAYSIKGLRFKEVPFLDSVTSSIHFVGPLVFAYALVGTTIEGWIIAGAFFLWGIASQAFGAVQDIIPDRAANIKSIATFLGARHTVRYSAFLYGIASIALILSGSWMTIAGIAGLMYVANVAPYLSLKDDDSSLARAGWRRFIWLNYIMGAIVTLLCIASAR